MIGYYVHHHGSGHLTRAEAIARHLTVPVVALSSKEIDSQVFEETVRLDRDDCDPAPQDVTAGGSMHWAPRRDPGLEMRMMQIARFVAERSPAAVVVDVSVEVTAFVRLLGVPVVVVAMPGDRTDLPHQLAYRMADAIIAPWPAELYQPDWLANHLEKTTFTGGISRFDGRRPHRGTSHRSDVLFLTGTGGEGADNSAEMTRFSHDHPDLTVTGLGPAFGTWAEDPWPFLCNAGVVVINAGQGSVADVAAARRPAVVYAQDRPFREQHTTAATLARAELAHVVSGRPRRDEWSDLIRQVPATCPGWARWQTEGAAGRAAAAIEATLR